MNIHTTQGILPPTKNALIALLILATSPLWAQEAHHQINSPDGNISVGFWISDDQAAYYQIEYGDAEVLQPSRMGLVRGDEDFSKDLSLESASEIEPVNDDYELFQGKRSHYSYSGNRRVFRLKNGSGEPMEIIFQVSNDGVAFRYRFPNSSDELKHINQEISSFQFPAGTRAWIQPMTRAHTGWSNVEPCYEQNYQQGTQTDRLPVNEPGWVFPALFNANGYWVLASETGLGRAYCASRLQHETGANGFSIGFPQPPEVFPGGPLNPESKLPWTTPWRILVVADDLKTVVESTLGTDLAEPSKISNTGFVKPGRASWSWALLKDDSVVYNVQKRFIDYASDMGWEYCLIDVNWDTRIGYDKIQELADYARGKNVGLILWYNSSGDWNSTTYHPKGKLLTHESREREFSRLREMGIKGIKVDFFAGDGQSMMTYYHDIFEDAARFGLMVNCHGATIPRGWHRTYPNLVTMEAVKGFEFITFEQGNANLEPEHCATLPFTRNVFDPMDFTPVCFSEIPRIRRVTRNGFELALSVLFWSGIQHYAETPEGMAQVPDYVKEFMRKVPNFWDDTEFIDGYPGKYVVIARRTGQTWYVGGINGENSEKRLSLRLPFVSESSQGILITDGSDPRSFTRRELSADPDQPIDVRLRGNGGFVMKFDSSP